MRAGQQWWGRCWKPRQRNQRQSAGTSVTPNSSTAWPRSGAGQTWKNSKMEDRSQVWKTATGFLCPPQTFRSTCICSPIYSGVQIIPKVDSYHFLGQSPDGSDNVIDPIFPFSGKDYTKSFIDTEKALIVFNHYPLASPQGAWTYHEVIDASRL